MTLRLRSITFDVTDPVRAADFWSGLLGRETQPDGEHLLVPGDATQVGLRFVAVESRGAGLNRAHLHVTSERSGGQARTVEAALDLGASHLDVGQLPSERHVVLADPVGDEFCVIEAGNGFLAGCGLLGELACDGTRAVGVFWSEALGWPLVWDENEETAIQSPAGGTKVAWGGPPVERKVGRNRQRFDLVVDGPDDLGAATARLVELGATVLEGTQGVLELADPDGNEFSLTAS